MSNVRTVTEALRAIRQSKEMSQRDFAEEYREILPHLPPSPQSAQVAISLYETAGRYGATELTTSHIRKLCRKVCGKSVGKMFPHLGQSVEEQSEPQERRSGRRVESDVQKLARRTFGSMLKECRSRAQLRQVDVAEACALSCTDPSYYETGRKVPSFSQLLHLGSVLDVSEQDFDVLTTLWKRARD